MIISIANPVFLGSSGKARKGDGNDLTPNPRKLWSIGKELDRLNKVIGEMTPVADVPSSVKSRSRKEKINSHPGNWNLIIGVTATSCRQIISIFEHENKSCLCFRSRVIGQTFFALNNSFHLGRIECVFPWNSRACRLKKKLNTKPTSWSCTD